MFQLHFQGQEIVAEKALELASKEGHWVILQVSELLYKKTVHVIFLFFCRIFIL